VCFCVLRKDFACSPLFEWEGRISGSEAGGWLDGRSNGVETNKG